MKIYYKREFYMIAYAGELVTLQRLLSGGQSFFSWLGGAMIKVVPVCARPKVLFSTTSMEN